MPMMLDHPAYLPMAQPEKQPPTHYGHPRGCATKCHHTLHPSAAAHTPLCPTCNMSAAKAKMNTALKGLATEGGLIPTDYLRDRRWLRAKLRYEVAKRRQAKTRSSDQLREEREEAWEDAHRLYDSQHVQATAAYLDQSNCPACASMTAYYSTQVLNTQTAKDIAWWEQPGGLVVDHIEVPRTPLRPVKPVRPPKKYSKVPSKIRPTVQAFRTAMAASDTHRQVWETRNKTESAVRRKHGLSEQDRFEPEFWDSPISAHLSLQNLQHTQANKRMDARRARGGTTRPTPPRSSLSYSKHIDEVEVDKSLQQRMSWIEDSDRVQRAAEKIGKEVGYLYFVGEVGLVDWREDYQKSDCHLVYRHDPEPEEQQQEEVDSTSEESGEDKESDDEDDDEDGYSFEEMDIDG
jgi:hypothetical protein